MPCSGDGCCPGFVIFEQLQKAFATQRPGEQERPPLGLLLTDLAVDHSACIRAYMEDEALDAFCSDLSMQTESTLGWAAAALSTKMRKKQLCSCARLHCRGGRRCRMRGASSGEKGAAAAPSTNMRTMQPCRCGRGKCRGGRRCPMTNQTPGNASLMLRSSLEAVLHGCDDMPPIDSELLLAHARQKAQGVDVRGFFITGLAGTFLAPDGDPGRDCQPYRHNSSCLHAGW